MNIAWQALRFGCYRAERNGHQIQIVRNCNEYVVRIDGRDAGWGLNAESAKSEAARILQIGSRS